MTELVHNAETLLTDVVKGLTANPKSLPSRYFYDATGDLLFQKIMQLPEYYLTRAESEILHGQGAAIVRQGSSEQYIQVVELGAGDGSKTKLLLQEMREQKLKFGYYPIDISPGALETITRNMENTFAGSIAVFPVEGEYFEALTSPVLQHRGKRLILFLGSNIGNYQPREASDFMGRISQDMNSGDQILVGFDLKKEPHIILDAYNDSQGITRQFNLNLLRRLNTELGANFNLRQFTHFPVYDPVQGAARSYLVSLCEQEVYIEAAEKKFHFRPYEAVFTEISQKYDERMIQEFADKHELEIDGIYKDSRGWFADVLYRKL